MGGLQGVRPRGRWFRPSPRGPSSRLARVVSVQSRPPPSEEMAEEPEPQVKGARPPPAPGPEGRPASPLRRPPEPVLEAPVLVISPPPRMIASPDPLFLLGSAPLGRPLPSRREGVGQPPVCTDCFTITLTLGNSRDGLGVGESPSPGREPGAGRREPGAAYAGRGGFPGKLDGSAWRVSRVADPAVGGRGPVRGPPRWPGRGLGKLETAKTMSPKRRPPQTMAGTVHTGRGRGLAWPRTPTRTPASPSGAPKSVPGSPSLLPVTGLLFLDIRLGFLFTLFNFKGFYKQL